MTKSPMFNRYVRFAQLAYRAAQATFPKFRHKKSKKTFTQPQLIACVLLKMYLNVGYRDGEDRLRATDQVRQVLELQTVPDHTTLHRAFGRLTETRARQLLESVLADLDVREDVIAGDSTGFTLSSAGAYYRTRSGKAYRGWVKGSYAVGTQSRLIPVARAGRGNTPSDARLLEPLRNGAQAYARGQDWVFLADAGLDGQAVGERDLIPPIRRGGKLVAPERKARADLVAQARLDGLFGQRWKTETVHSVIKRKFGGDIRSRLSQRQDREPLIKAVVYNLYR
ncbi:MAG: transposase [Anaerolineales bacterium]|nr:transposase [Anaerolineales bacterium]